MSNENAGLGGYTAKSVFEIHEVFVDAIMVVVDILVVDHLLLNQFGWCFEAVVLSDHRIFFSIPWQVITQK